MSPSPRHGLFFPAVPMGASILVLSCGGASESEVRAAALSLSPSQGQSPEQRRVAYKLGALDPARDGWSSEVFNARVGERLTELKQLLTDPRTLRVERLEPLLDPSFACDELRPVEQESVYRHGALEVRRGDAGRRLEGVEGFATALNALLAGAHEGSPPRAVLKVVGVEGGGGNYTTPIAFHLFFATDEGRRQVNAHWRCRWTQAAPDAPPLLAGIEVEDYEEVSGPGDGTLLFEDCTRAVFAGVASFEEQLEPGIQEWCGALDRSLRPAFFGHEGIAVGDIDGDGRDDLYVCQIGGLPNRLYRQDEQGRALDVSSASGVDYLDLTHGALFVDLDGDGDQDLVVGTMPLSIHANDGQGRFRLAAEFDAGTPYSLASADYDADGDLDLYVCQYAEAVYSVAPIPYHDANNGEANVLLRNDGELRFTDVTAEVGLDVNNRRFSFAASWADYDEDGDADLYVANDYGRNNLYRNDGGRFTDVAGEAGVEDISAGMSAAWGDYDADGDVDLYVGNMFSSAGNRIAYQRRFKGDADDATRAQIQRHARGNSLFENSGDGTFRDVSLAAGVSTALWAWGSKFIDVDNDGLEDLVVANGMVTGSDPEDL